MANAVIPSHHGEAIEWHPLVGDFLESARGARYFWRPRTSGKLSRLPILINTFTSIIRLILFLCNCSYGKPVEKGRELHASQNLMISNIRLLSSLLENTYIPLSLCLSICIYLTVSVCLSIFYLCLPMSFYLSNLSMYVPTHLPTCLPTYPPI